MESGDSGLEKFLKEAKKVVEKQRANIVGYLSRGLSIEEKEKLLWRETHRKSKPVEKEDVENIVAETAAEISKREKSRAYLENWSRSNRRSEEPVILEESSVNLDEKGDDASDDPSHHSATDQESPANDDISEQIKESQQRIWDPATGEIQSHDPILGKLISVQKYKRLYTIGIRELIRIPVWDNNRTYKKERAHNIAKDLKKNKSTDRIILPGTITVYEKPWDSVEGTKPVLSDELKAIQASRERYGIIDGQHRVGALKKLYDDGDYDDPVNIEVIEVLNEEAVIRLFNDINKAEPVQPVDKAKKSELSQRDREILQSAVASLKSQYPQFFKPSIKCRKPHMNEDLLRNMLFEAKVITRYKIKTDAALLAWLLAENNFLAKKSDDEFLGPNSLKSERDALVKAKKFGFYLGMDRNWLMSDTVPEEDED